MTTLIASTLGAPAAWGRGPFVVDDDRVQCADAAYETIADALSQSSDGDQIKVCPGLYPEQLRVTKQVRIVGPTEAVGRLDCLADTPPDLDTTRYAILEPPDPTAIETATPLLTVDADNVDVSGLVFRGVIDTTADTDPSGAYGFVEPALASSDTRSGYRIRQNAFVSNTLAFEFGSNGSARSRFENNCLRDNEFGVANQRLGLNNAVIGANASFRSSVIAYEIGWGYRATGSVLMRDNVSRLDQIAMRFENTAGTRVTGNTVTSAPVAGMEVVGGNSDIKISGNQVLGPASDVSSPVSGIRFSTPSGTVPSRSTGVDVRRNSASGIRTTNTQGNVFGVGIVVGVGALDGATFADNTMFGNAQAGMSILDGNTNNVIRGNQSYDNTNHGIRVQGLGSFGNLFQGNRMYGNGLADARDDTDPNLADGVQLLNRWIGNDCITDLPPGAICPD